MHQNIISMEPVAHGHNHFIFMPLHPTTLEHLPYLQGEEVVLRRLWNQVSSGLSFLHEHGFAHMDVKPSNILITTSGDFILADLGSVAWSLSTTAGTCGPVRVGLS
jgi:serine/threonine protein kinase